MKNSFLLTVSIAIAALSLASCKQDKAAAAWTQPKAEVLDVQTTIACADALENVPNQWVAFRKDFSIEKVPETVPARIAVDSKYWLWINGKMAIFEGALKRGPKPGDAYYDEVDLAPFLKKGENKIALLLWYFGKDGFSHSGSGKAQLWFDAPAVGVTSDESWLCRVHPAYFTANLPVPNYRLSESSIGFDAQKDIEGWQTGSTEGFAAAVATANTLGKLHTRPVPQWKDFGIKKAEFEVRAGEQADTLIAPLTHNMQMTPVLVVDDKEGGHRIIIETDHAIVGEQCVRAEYITKAGSQEYESLGWISGKTIILTVEHGAKVKAIKYRETGYDAEPAGKFACSDPFFNTFWDKALRTIYVNTRDNFFDCPDRERAQWWGDLTTILGECFYTYDVPLHALLRKAIWELCDWQRSDDILFAPIPGNYNVELPCQIMAAVSRFGIWTYYMNTGDKETIEHVYPALKKYAATYHVGEDGMVAWHQGEWNWGDWGDERDMHLLQNMWYCLTLDCLINSADLLGYADEADAYRTMRNGIMEAVNRICWNGSSYRFPEYSGLTDDRVNALAVVTGIAQPDKYDAIYEVLKKEEHSSPYMERYVMEALFIMGHGDYAVERVKRRFGPMVNHKDYDTLFENWLVGADDGFGGSGSVNHAWSGGPLTVLCSTMLGIRPVEAGWTKFAICPDQNIFDNCSLSFPTVKGTVAATFKRSGDKLSLSVEVPEGTEAEVNIPWAGIEKTLGPGKHTL